MSAISSAGEYLAAAHEIFTSDDLALAIRMHSDQYASSGSISVRTKRKLRAPRPFSKLGHAHRIRLLRSSAIVPRVLDRYIKDATHANFLNQAKGPLPGVASSSRRCTSFCELREVPPFPIHEEVAILRGSVFDNTAAFGRYVDLVEK